MTPKLPRLTKEDLELFHYNPNTSDIANRVVELQLDAWKAAMECAARICDAYIIDEYIGQDGARRCAKSIRSLPLPE